MIDLTTKTENELRELIMAAIDELGSRRFSEGGAAMRDAIFQATQFQYGTLLGAAATTAAGTFGGKSLVGSAPSPEAAKTRAPRGLIGKAIDPILRANPGMLVPDLEAAVKCKHPEIHPKSIGNELRRFDGEKYKRDREGGYRWFLIDDQDSGSTGATTPAAEIDDDI